MEPGFPTFREAQEYVTGEVGSICRDQLQVAYSRVLCWVRLRRIRRSRTIILDNILTLAEAEVSRASTPDVRPRGTKSSDQSVRPSSARVR